MIHKKIYALAWLLVICIVVGQLPTTAWPLTILAFHPITGIVILLLYDSKNFLRGRWDLAKTGILTVVMSFGYFCLLLYIFAPRDDKAPNRT